MTDLQRRAMARVPLTEAEVGYLHLNNSSRPSVLALAESHERLRMELEGATKLLAEAEGLALSQGKLVIDQGEALSRLRAEVESLKGLNALKDMRIAVLEATVNAEGVAK